jgi:1-acyl-sn-glycerol-3-phosphate acyltransferase
MPAAGIRRPLTVTAWLVLSLLGLLLSPLLLVFAAIACALTRRRQPLMLVRLLVAYFERELGVLIACGALWLISGFGWRMRSHRIQLLHYRLLRWYVAGLAQRVLSLLELDIAPDPSPEAIRALQTDQPLLFFSRHAGPGDTLLLIHLLLSRYHRFPRVVFKDTLALDPCVDLMGHRLPHAILDTSDPDRCEERISEVTAELDDRGVLVLFPEGGNFTHQRRRHAIDRLWRKGRAREAAAAEDMSHMLPPHPAGALAALRARPDADVIFSAHTGLGLAAFPRQLWQHTPIGQTLKTRMWLVPAQKRPQDPDEQVRWLYDWWKRLDNWVASEGEEVVAAG